MPNAPKPSTGTSSEVTRALEKKGFTHDFTVIEGRMTDRETGESLDPGRFRIVESYRFEGASDPEDSEVLYALESDSGVKGTLLDAYGAYSDPVKSRFVSSVGLQHETKAAASADAGPVLGETGDVPKAPGDVKNK